MGLSKIGRTSRFVTAAAFLATASIALSACTSFSNVASSSQAVKKRTKTTTPPMRKPSTPKTNAAAAAPAGGGTSKLIDTEPSTTAPKAPKETCAAKIMPLGDSLTGFAESYRGPLYRSLKSLEYDVDFVGSLKWPPAGGGDSDSEGHGGFRIGPDDGLDTEGNPSNLSQNIEAWLSLSKPDIILLAIGTNDLAQGGRTAEEAPGKLQALVSKIETLRPNAIVVVGDVVPNIYNTKANAVTQAVNKMAQQLGSVSPTDNVVYAPNYSSLTRLGFDPATDTNDGTHFTVAAGELYAKAWLPVVRSVLDGRSC